MANSEGNASASSAGGRSSIMDLSLTVQSGISDASYELLDSGPPQIKDNPIDEMNVERYNLATPREMSVPPSIPMLPLSLKNEDRGRSTAITRRNLKKSCSMGRTPSYGPSPKHSASPRDRTKKVVKELKTKLSSVQQEKEEAESAWQHSESQRKFEVGELMKPTLWRKRNGRTRRAQWR